MPPPSPPNRPWHRICKAPISIRYAPGHYIGHYTECMYVPRHVRGVAHGPRGKNRELMRNVPKMMSKLPYTAG